MEDNISKLKNNLIKSEEWLSKEYSQIHTGKASPILLDSINMDSYGAKTPIKNLASISVEDPKTLRVSPWDKSQIKDMEKVLLTSNIGASVSVDDAGLRVIFPPLTSERRVSLAKILKEKLEEAKVAVKMEREKVLEDMKKKEKEGSISEDNMFKMKEKIQEVINESHKKLEEIFKIKEKDILEN